MSATPAENSAHVDSTTPQPRGVNRKTDVTLSVVFLGLQFVFVVASLFLSLAIVLSLLFPEHGTHPDAWGGALVCALGPGIIFRPSLGVGLFLLIKKRRAWIFTLVGLAASVGIWVLGYNLIYSNWNS